MEANTLFVTGARGQLAKAFIERSTRFIHQYYEDIADYGVLAKQIHECSLYNSLPDKVIVNCAAFNNVPKCEDHDLVTVGKMLRANVLGPRNVASLAAQYDFPLVHFSSNYVFDGIKDCAYNLSDKPNPINRYGASKLAGEDEIRSRMKGEYFIVRLGNVYGPGVSKYNFIIKMIETLKKSKGKSVSYTFDEWINPAYTLDIVKAVDELLADHTGGVYHFGSKNGVTRYEIAKYIVEKYKLDVEVRPALQADFGSRIRIPKMGVLDPYPLKTRDFYESLDEYLELFFNDVRNRPSYLAPGGGVVTP